jgi:hypothetical protein
MGFGTGSGVPQPMPPSPCHPAAAITAARTRLEGVGIRHTVIAMPLLSLRRLLLACVVLTCCCVASPSRAAPATSTAPGFTIDADFPGGNIIVDKVDGNDVHLRPDLRDTSGTWFYWCFRVRGAAGRNLTFHFTRYDPVGVRGPAVSLDGGRTWKWLGRASATVKSFTYAFPPSVDEVRFGVGMTYTSEHLETFLKTLPKDAPLRQVELCKTRKGRSVPVLHVGKIDGEPRFRILITARHHACEMMASYAVEGIIAAALADDELGKWFRANVELAVVPFADRDGVEDGDQGKNRKPRDHNRDYDGESKHVETAALRAYVPMWAAGRLVAAFDLHCPALRGGSHEYIYQVGKEGPTGWDEQQKLGKLLEGLRKGSLPYKASNDMPFGKDWNTVANFKQGMSCARWAATIPGVRIAGTFEIPYANAGGAEVNADSARAFGRDLAAAMKAYLEQ